MQALQAFIDGVSKAIASADAVELENLQSQLEEMSEAISKLQDELQERQFELETEAEEEQSRLDAIADAEIEQEEAERTGPKEKDLKVTTETGEAIISKHKQTWEVLLLHEYYGQCQYLSLCGGSVENEVLEKCKFYLNTWPFEIKEYVGWYSGQRVEVTAEEILAKGLAAAREDKLQLLFNN